MLLKKKMYQAFYQSLILVGTSSQVRNYKNTITLPCDILQFLTAFWVKIFDIFLVFLLKS